MKALMTFIALLLALISMGPSAHAKSVFTLDEINHTLEEFFTLPMLQYSEEDVRTAELAVAEMIATLPVNNYNKVILQLAGDYASKPDRAKAISSVLGQVKNTVEPELKEVRERRAIITVIDDVLTAFGTLQAIGFGRGVLVRPSANVLRREALEGGMTLITEAPLRGIARFSQVVKSAVQRLPGFKKTALASIGIGGTAGILHVVYHHFETVRLDPIQALERAQLGVAKSLAERAFGARQEMDALSKEVTEEPNDLRVAEIEERLRKDGDLPELLAAYSLLEDGAPQLRSIEIDGTASDVLSPIADDLGKARATYSRLLLLIEARKFARGF